MLPEDPVLRSRLLQCARLLLGWSQARLACEVEVSTATIHAVESGRLSTGSPAAQAMVRGLERAGVQFIPPIGTFGPGLRLLSAEVPKRLSRNQQQGPDRSAHGTA